MHTFLELLGGAYLITGALATIFPKAKILQALALDFRKLWDILSPGVPPPQ